MTPMMQQYLDTKKEYKDCILFYRLGDFYEMFFEDALTASKELEITLTGKSCGQEERAPMCGVPYHAVDTYLNKLVSKGYKVAICEQVEDPKSAKGIVKREVIRVVTPGTNLNIQALDDSKNNYLLCVAYFPGKIGLSVADVTTGDYYLTEVEDIRRLQDEINKYAPSEVICNEQFFVSGYDIEDLKSRLNVSVYSLSPHYFDEDGCKKTLMRHFRVNTLKGLGIEDFPVGITAAGALLTYLYETQKTSLSHMTHIYPYLSSKYMLLDSSTRRNLELLETLREKQKKGSLLGVLDRTKTALGGRLLRKYIEQPLIDGARIEKRLNAVEELCKRSVDREELREYLHAIYDLERLLGRISYKTANPRDLIALRNSLAMLPSLRTVLADFDAPLLKEIREHMDPLEDIHKLIDDAIMEEPPIAVREGGIIREGFNGTIDSLKKAKTDGKKWLAQLEEEDRERTGIRNLRIKYNKVFGYYFEVTNSYRDLVPEDYVRKQTLANAERYTTPRLKELEDSILNAEDKLFALEYDLFCEIREAIAGEVERIQKTARSVARLDVFTSLAFVAEQNHYVRPALNEKGVIDIKEGRHPVVEQMIQNDMFIANDTHLDDKKHCIAVITGPNMAGKSTYMRQVALIVLMAQMGSFVPARSAHIGVVDRVFTRIGASDDLASGQSTFMVEMTEVAALLNHATRKSLLILDEIGRGTSTYDGMAIARAVLEYCADKKRLGAKTLFATHYHELTALEGTVPGVKNYNIAAKKRGSDVIFLRKIVRGGADESYGVEVAKLAGVPDRVVKRARAILEELESQDWRPAPTASAPAEDQVSLMDLGGETVLKKLRMTDVNILSPIEALNLLAELKQDLNGG